MRLGTVRHDGATTAARVGEGAVELLPHVDLGALLRAADDPAALAPIGTIDLDEAEWAPPVIAPDKIVCVGLNYREHVLETGNQPPAAPAYFAKYRSALIGANDDIELPPADVSTSVDWEVELCVIIGRPARRVSVDRALDHVAGYTVLNDVSVRDWQRRTKLYLAGKTFEHSTPVGPWMTTADELGDGGGLRVTTTVDGVVKQDSNTDELVFGVAELVADLSTILTLEPGDLIATGTPSGVGGARTPPEWLTDGAEVVTAVEGIGELRNRCVRAV